MENVIFLFLQKFFDETTMSIKDILHKIKELREEKNISQNKMSKLIFIGRSTYTKVENGEIELTLDRFMKICDVLGVKPAFFLFEEETDRTDMLIGELETILKNYKNGAN